MACLQKYSGNLSWGCSSGARGGTLGKYTEAILINASDIDSFSGGGGNATLVLASSQKGSVVEVTNNGLKVSVARKGGDMFPVMYDPSVIMKVPHNLLSTASGAANEFVNASFVIALNGSNGYTIIGLGAPLVCTEIEGDSTAGEFLTITFGTDEGQTGSTIYGISKATYESLKVPAV
ncbi:hypothetical protein BV283P2_00030 [Phocaeicola phage BV283P2]|nr:hypothetical protein BV283P2_00030 [Phocaeicola phage BV283P2]